MILGLYRIARSEIRGTFEVTCPERNEATPTPEPPTNGEHEGNSTFDERVEH